MWHHTLGGQTVCPMGQIEPVTYFVNKVLLEQSPTHSFTCCVQLLLEHKDSYVVVAETLGLAKLKLFNTWLFTEKLH